MRFCVDCRFCVQQDDRLGFTCAAGLDPVTGTQRHAPCEDERSPVWAFAQCGPDAKLFKEAEDMRAKQLLRKQLVDDSNSASGKRLDG